MPKRNTNSGFTIVEFLVVLVAIAIIAAITLVGYNLILQNAIATSLQTNLKNAAKQLVVDGVRSTTGVFPATLAVANNGSGINFPSTTTTTYKVDNTDTPKTFCLTATQNSQTYFITQEATPLPGPCPALYLDPGLQSSYSGTGTVLTDLSGNGNNGVISGGVSYSNSYGGVLVFDGASGTVTITDPVSGILDFGNNNFTISVWVKFPLAGSSTWDGIISKGYTSSAPANTWGIVTGNPVTGLYYEDSVNAGGSFNANYSFSSVPVSNLHNVAVTRSGGTAYKFYLDGVQNGLLTSGQTANLSNANDVLIGVAGGRFLNSSIGEIRIYNQALTANDIRNNFNALRVRCGL